MVWTKGIMRGISKDSQLASKGNHRHAPIRPDRSSSKRDRPPAGDLTTKQETAGVWLKTPTALRIQPAEDILPITL